MDKNILANEVQIDSIINYVSQRYGIYGVKSYNFKIEEHPKLTYGQSISQEIDLKGVGLFKHALVKCIFYVEVWRRDEETRYNYCSTRLSYEHITGGRNGCELDCNFTVDLDGKIQEHYRY